MADTVGVKNPYRYRGYRYDTETGLYYLQSRYYDPEIGRFINADVYVDTGDTVLSTNMFAYCENNPINNYDPNGKDAIWLQDTNSVGNLGHTGLLLQDSNKKWWHFYWGANRTGKKGKSGTYSSFIKLIGYSWNNLSGLNNYLNSHKYYYKNKFVKIYSGRYEAALYFHGDFSASVNYAKKLTRRYNLVWNNCLQVSMDVLRRGKFQKNNIKYKALLWNSRQMIIPNAAFFSFAYFNRNLGA